MHQSTSLDPHDLEFSIAALVLAGGQSRRMGTDKALLCWQGIPMLQRVCQIAVQCCDPVCVLTPWPERYEHVLPKNCLMLKETLPGRGPLVALAQGLSQLKTTWVLLLACDLPLLRSDVLSQWLTILSDNKALAVVPHHAEQWEPLCGFYHHQSRSSLQSFIHQGGQSFQHWLSTIPTQKITLDVTSTAMLWNCNSLQDLIPPEV